MIKCMQNIGQQKLLVLFFMRAAERQHGGKRRQVGVACRFNCIDDACIDHASVVGNLSYRWT